MDSLFKQRFSAAKCKTLLKLSIPRIKLLRNRREVQIKQMRKEIAKLLETGQEATARIRVEHIIREDKMMAAQEIVELFCELIAVRLPIIEAQKECPLDLKEAISSVCFAAPRCADLPELLQVQILFSGKYGKEFVAAATELMPDCGVNRQLVELLSIRAPSPEVKLKLLTEIAEEHGLDWDASATEHELLKKHEDLLSGPTQFTSGSKLALPKEKHEEIIQASTSKPAGNEIPDNDDLDILGFPEVPRMPPKTNISTPETLPFPVSALSEDDNEESNPGGPAHVVLEKPVAKEDASTRVAETQSGGERLVPLETRAQSPPFLKEKQATSGPVASNTSVDLQDVLAAAQAAAETAERAAAAARSAASIAQRRISELVNKKNDEVPTPVHTVAQGGRDGKMLLADSSIASPPTTDNGFLNGGANQPSQYDPQAAEYRSSPPVDNEASPSADHKQHHQPQRLPSMDEESLFSYPNLFSSHGAADLSSRT